MDLPSATHVADFLLGMAKLDHGMQLDQLQINKDCYLVNGFVLRKRDEPAFRDDVEAWRYGPVIPAVYQAYKGFGHEKIPRLGMCRTPLDDAEAVRCRCVELAGIIGRDVAATARGVLDEYGRCDGPELVAMTHGKETPWKKAYKAGRNNVISTETIRQFYRNLTRDDRRR